MCAFAHTIAVNVKLQFVGLLPLSFLQVAAMLGVSQQQLLDSLPESLQVGAAAAEQLHLQQRACHVFTEASRVLAFKHTCESDALPPNRQLQQLGELLNASHSSCSQLYQCSCPELDTLVDTARAAGAIGARLTGGWVFVACHECWQLVL
jgi:N-acetylgalactosamine kinase